MPFKTLFDILNQLNGEKNIVSHNTIYDFSKMLENRIVDNYKDYSRNDLIKNKKHNSD